MEPTCQACHLSSAEDETSCEHCGEPSGNTRHQFMDLTENTPEGGSGWSSSPAGMQPDETDNEERRQRIQFMADRIAHLTSISDALDKSVRRRMQKVMTHIDNIEHLSARIDCPRTDGDKVRMGQDNQSKPEAEMTEDEPVVSGGLGVWSIALLTILLFLNGVTLGLYISS